MYKRLSSPVALEPMDRLEAYPTRYCKTFAASMIISGVARRQ
jgi:hypothetical protein